MPIHLSDFARLGCIVIVRRTKIDTYSVALLNQYSGSIGEHPADAWLAACGPQA